MFQFNKKNRSIFWMLFLTGSLILFYGKLFSVQYEYRQMLKQNDRVQNILQDYHEEKKHKLRFRYTKDKKFNYIKSQNNSTYLPSHPLRTSSKPLWYQYDKLLAKINLTSPPKSDNKKKIPSTAELYVEKGIPSAFLPRHQQLYLDIQRLNPYAYRRIKRKFDQLPASERERISLAVFSSDSDVDTYFLNQYALFLSYVSRRSELPLLKKLFKMAGDRTSKLYLKRAINRFDYYY